MFAFHDQQGDPGHARNHHPTPTNDPPLEHGAQPPNARATEASLALIRQFVPGELQVLPRWVCWDGTRKVDGRLDKTPIEPATGRNARTDDPSTWTTFELACPLALRDERIGGLGLVLTNSNYWALDLDHVINKQTGEVAPLARKFLASLVPTYTELSPSGDGLHLIFRGNRPPELARTRAKDAFGMGMHLEVFGGTSSRYLTMTGQVWGAA